MKQIVKNFNNLIKNTIFKVKNKTNINFKFGKLNNQIQKIIFKVQNKTNINLKFDNLNIVKKFNNWVEKAIFRVQNKSINKLPISKFNKYIISFISLLFFYLFYLLTPLLYDKAWVQKNIENKILSEFKINISSSSDISYRILPSPHFLIRNSKIFLNEDTSQKFIADVKKLKIFLNQKNFFNKEKITLKKLIIDSANFSLLREELKIFNDSTKNQFSNKRIKINNSNIFFKDNFDSIITIIKINKAIMFFDDEKQLNLFNLKGNAFGVPFTFDLKSENDTTIKREISLEVKPLKLNISNKSIEKSDILKSGKNNILFFNTAIKTKYDIKEKLISFVSEDSRLNAQKIDYNGELSINPFNLDLNIDLGYYKISKLFNFNSILKEFIKSEVLFNNNLSLQASILAKTNVLDEIFQKTKINFQIVNGKLNLDNSIFINKKIGYLELNNSDLFFENNKLLLNTDILITIKDSKRLFSTLNTNKKSRNEIKNIFINLNYDFLGNEIKFNSIKVDNSDMSDQFLYIMDEFNDNNLNNMIKSRRLINKLFDVYDG